VTKRLRRGKEKKKGNLDVVFLINLFVFPEKEKEKENINKK
jgi:hypothetical protein